MKDKLWGCSACWLALSTRHLRRPYFSVQVLAQVQSPDMFDMRGVKGRSLAGIKSVCHKHAGMHVDHAYGGGIFCICVFTPSICMQQQML